MTQLGQMNATEAAAAIHVVEAMFAAWDAFDWDGVVNAFTEDGVMHSMYKEPFVGREAIRARLDAVGPGMEMMRCEIKSIGCFGRIVAAERIDTFTFNGRTGSVPCAGFFEIQGGKISRWREYCDSATILSIIT
jgi:limonene-1,2-epoxide hydrolase